MGASGASPYITGRRFETESEGPMRLYALAVVCKRQNSGLFNNASAMSKGRVTEKEVSIVGNLSSIPQIEREVEPWVRW